VTGVREARLRSATGYTGEYVMVVSCLCGGVLGLYRGGRLDRQARMLKEWMRLHRACHDRGGVIEEAERVISERAKRRIVKEAERIIKKSQRLSTEEREFVEEMRKLIRGYNGD